MKTQKILSVAAGSFIVLSALSLLSVSMMAFMNPQQVMDLVKVKLDNTDAFSSIRGVYGGVGLSIVVLLVYLARFNKKKALLFLGMFWGLYAISRVITIFAEGSLGDFGKQWLTIESLFSLIAVVLFLLLKNDKRQQLAVTK